MSEDAPKWPSQPRTYATVEELFSAQVMFPKLQRLLQKHIPPDAQAAILAEYNALSAPPEATQRLTLWLPG